MKKQTLFNIFICIWLMVISVWLLIVTLFILGDNYEETMKKFGLPSDIDNIVSKVVEDGQVSPELTQMVKDLLAKSSQTNELPHSKPRTN